MNELGCSAHLYRAQAIDAIEGFNQGDHGTCDRVCSKLLLCQELPKIGCAEANLPLATSDSNTDVAFAAEAVRLREGMSQNDADS